MLVKSRFALYTDSSALRFVSAIGEAVVASVALLSMYSMDLLPAPYNSVVFGGGAGLLTATAVAAKAKHKKPEPIGVVGVLPGVQMERSGKSRSATGKPVEKERLLKRFDRAFGELLSRRGLDSRLKTLEKMKPMIYELSPDMRAWTGDVRIRVYLLMQEIAKDIDEPAFANASLGILVLILLKGGNSALEMARPMFQEKIHRMYSEPKHENERYLPRLILMLDDYDKRRVENVTRDAIHSWGNRKFRAASGYLGFEELTQRGMRGAVRDIIRGEIARAGNDRDGIAAARAIELYCQVR